MNKLLLFLAAMLASVSLSFAKTPAVVVDIAPLQSLVAKVMNGVGEPVALLHGNDDPHHLQLRPSQARLLARADLVFWVGPALTPWLAQGLENLAPKARVISLQDIEESRVRKFDDGGLDPHGWLDPDNAKIWVDAVANELAAADPENRTIYAENAVLAKREIETAAQEATHLLAAARDAGLVFSHDGFGYYSDYFEIQNVASIANSDAAKPGAAKLSDIRHLFKSGQVTCTFYEVGQSPAMLKNLTDGTNVAMAELDILGTKLPTGPAQFDALIVNLARDISNCVQQNHAL